MKNIFITGTAGFIGFHLAKLLLKEGFKVHGYDSINDYYDVNLKHARQNILLKDKNFSTTKGLLEDNDKLNEVADKFQPDIIIHLAAQAGVRYSLENPRAYINSNIIGTFNVMELARKHEVKHLLMASTSSVYGANTEMPFTETEKADTQLTIYAATKKSNESMAHSYSHLWKIPTTMFRFFTVYGPWGRPDMALFKFVNGIINNKPIDIYNNGEMYRDFTYVDDLVNGIKLLVDCIPDNKKISENDSLSPVAPLEL
jgi:UDP-glucuronate 4-epimerase